MKSTVLLSVLALGLSSCIATETYVDDKVGTHDGPISGTLTGHTSRIAELESDLSKAKEKLTVAEARLSSDEVAIRNLQDRLERIESANRWQLLRLGLALHPNWRMQLPKASMKTLSPLLLRIWRDTHAKKTFEPGSLAIESDYPLLEVRQGELQPRRLIATYLTYNGQRLHKIDLRFQQEDTPVSIDKNGMVSLRFAAARGTDNESWEIKLQVANANDVLQAQGTLTFVGQPSSLEITLEGTPPMSDERTASP